MQPNELDNQHAYYRIVVGGLHAIPVSLAKRAGVFLANKLGLMPSWDCMQTFEVNSLFKTLTGTDASLFRESNGCMWNRGIKDITENVSQRLGRNPFVVRKVASTMLLGLDLAILTISHAVINQGLLKKLPELLLKKFAPGKEDLVDQPTAKIVRVAASSLIWTLFIFGEQAAKPYIKAATVMHVAEMVLLNTLDEGGFGLTGKLACRFGLQLLEDYKFFYGC